MKPRCFTPDDECCGLEVKIRSRGCSVHREYHESAGLDMYISGEAARVFRISHYHMALLREALSQGDLDALVGLGPRKF